MLWILFVLPALTWAGEPAILGLPPPLPLAPVNSLGPIDGVCPNKCKPLSQCSVWYRDFSFIPQKPCSSPEGFVGVCCPDVLNVKPRVIKFIGFYESRNAPSLPVSPAVVEESAQSARLDTIHMKQVEEFLTRQNMMMQRDSMAYGHSSNMAPTLAATIQADKGLLMINAALRIQGRLNLPPNDAVERLRIDARATSLQATCLPTPICVPFKYRSFDGTCNNLLNPNWGRALTPQERLLPPVYDDGIWAEKVQFNGRPLPNARMLSSVVATDENHPSIGMTHMSMQWGQFIDHDMTHIPVWRAANQSNIDCCTPNGGLLPPEARHPHCFPIDILPQDPFYGPRGVRCLNFVRSMIAPRADCRIGYADQMNQLTSFIDGSHIYGSSEEKALTLREFVGGRMLVSIINGKPFLPDNPNARGCIKGGFGCFVSGDTRTNQVMGLTALHVLFLRQHNAIATGLSRINPQWNDEILFQEARRINVAILQHITYNEFVPTILGRPIVEAYGLTPQTDGYSTSYDQTVNPSITNEFSTAAYRMGHSMIQRVYHLVEEDGRRRVELMRNWFDNPQLLRAPGVMDAILRGLSDEWSQNVDEWVVDDVTKYLFKSPNRDFGFDLISLNVWRGRDHGLPGYTQYRQICGLPPVRTFDDLAAFVNPKIVPKLAAIYRTVDEIDLYIGGLVENHVPNAVVGPVFSCIIADQFSRLKEGDRFYYENGGHPHSFTPLQLQEIRKMSLAAVMCDQADRILKMQPLVFRDPSQTNPRVPCNNPMIPRLNLLAWKE